MSIVRQSDANWLWNPKSKQWIATLTDVHGAEWKASIENMAQAFIVSTTQFTAALFAHQLGIYHSSNFFSSIDEAKAWCYVMLDIVA